MADPVAIATYAARAGFRGTDLIVAVAVALGESGGNANKAGGLWNIPGAAGGDPAGNAAAAFSRWRSGGWGQWGAYRNNRYALFLPAAGAAATAESVVRLVDDPVGYVQDAVSTLAGKLPGGDALAAAQDALTLGYKAGAWLSDRNNWVRIAQVVVGSGMLLGAVIIISKPAVDTVTGAAGSVVKPLVKAVV